MIDDATTAAIDLFVSRISARYDIAAAILFGSRARGTHQPDSDADLAVILRGEHRRIIDTTLEMADSAYDILLETGINITPLPVWLDDWERPENYSNPEFIAEVRQHGIVFFTHEQSEANLLTRKQNVEAALATARLSGQVPSANLATLLTEYQAGRLSADEVVANIKIFYS